MKKKYLTLFLCLSINTLATGISHGGGNSLNNSTLSSNSNSTSIKSGTLSYALLQYCVPKSADGCVNKATYSNGKCICPAGKFYLDRECFNPACPAGTYVTYDNYTDSCFLGTTILKRKN